MIYSPQKKMLFNTLLLLVLLGILGSAIAVCRYFQLPSAIWQGVFFVEAVFMCELLTKFYLPTYTYMLNPDSFKITKTMGGNITTVCNIDADRIVALYTKKEYKKQEEYEPRSVYNYNGNPFTTSCYVMVFEYSTSCEAVVFEPDREMANAILCLTENQ